jgi:hypothetical protein
MPDAGLACVASFAVSENTSSRRMSRAVSGEVQFFKPYLLNPFLRNNLLYLDFTF